MTHVRIPDFSARLPGAPTIEHVRSFAEPSLGAPGNLASQITWLRGSSSDREQEAVR